ncbi:unnamed protein product [Sordaria macrospora k-hell]|uniref:WGS project CABT00000000 data, contig 2.27 n=1 Tax=Sordaria macrospora (strain ATCC MYA-333 / DSM 997 / K(L3346) / K-hell) TaxID=771870 RepID=F7W480_SORMK|nr:uncharacterized protein SMAC_09402 [Sordaria macrospora k-hell]CCC14833.1 unnamed protein product [Sordaria macrospora k-hell]
MTRRRGGRPWGYYSERYYDIPQYLHFVQHPGSQSWEDDDGSFVAADTCSTGRRGLFHLEDQISLHVDWYYRGPTCFISTFADYDHAYNWARQRFRPTNIYTIDTSRLPDDFIIFYAGRFNSDAFDSEYLFLDFIPGYSIIYCECLPRYPNFKTIHSVPGLESSVELGAPVVPVHYLALPQVLGPPPRFPPPPYQEVHALCLGSQAAPMPDPAQTPSLAPIGTRPPNEERVPPLPGSGRNAPTPPAPAPSPPPNRSPPSYEAPHHFASPPYTTPAQYITPVPPVGTLPPVPPAAESGTYAQSDPGGPRAPGQESSTAPSATSPAHTSPGHTPGHLTPSQIMSGQNLPAVPVVGFPPPPLPQPIDETTASEPPVSSAPEPSTASDPGPSDQPEPVRNAETPGQSQPERAFGSNSGTPGRPNISFFAEDSDMEVSDAEGSPSFTRAIKSKPSSPAPSGPSGAKLNFFAED